MKIIKYIILPAVIIIMLIFTVTNSEGLNYWLTWGGNRAAWVYSDSGYIYPTLPIRMKAGDSLKYNGVTVTSGTGGGGSGDVVAAGDNTLTGINTFTDSLRANGYSLIDDAKITSYLRVTGEVTTDLNFNKGSLTKIGTISTDSLAFITDNTKRIVIDKNGYTVFTDTVQMLDRVYISGNLNVASNIYTTGNILADSIAGIGRFITDVDAITLKGQDTTHFARLDTLTTERVKSKTEFSDIVTFFLSPVFSALVNFANGINVTGNATISGYTSLGDSSTAIKTKLIKFKVGGSTNTYYPSSNHGIRANRVVNWSVIMKDSATKQTFIPRHNLVAADYYAVMTDTNIQVYLNTGNTYLLSDSAFITISYLP